MIKSITFAHRIFFPPFIYFVLFPLGRAGLTPKPGMAEATSEGLAFPYRPSRQSFGPEDIGVGTGKTETTGGDKGYLYHLYDC